MKSYDKAISAIDGILHDKRLSTAEALDAMENIRDYVEPWIDALEGDLANEAAKAEGGD